MHQRMSHEPLVPGWHLHLGTWAPGHLAGLALNLGLPVWGQTTGLVSGFLGGGRGFYQPCRLDDEREALRARKQPHFFQDDDVHRCSGRTRAVGGAVLPRC